MVQKWTKTKKTNENKKKKKKKKKNTLQSEVRQFYKVLWNTLKKYTPATQITKNKS